MPENIPNITQIPAIRVPLIDSRTGLMSVQWFRFFVNLFQLTGNGSNSVSLEDLQLSPQAFDNSGDFANLYDQSQLSYTSPPQLGTISSYNLDSSPTAGSIIYGTGKSLDSSQAGTIGQVLTSQGSSEPTWENALTSISSFSWAPTLGTLVNITGTPSVSYGAYVKVSYMTHIQLKITATVTSSATLTTIIVPLPFDAYFVPSTPPVLTGTALIESTEIIGSVGPAGSIDDSMQITFSAASGITSGSVIIYATLTYIANA